jgi:hypothetical protein
MNLTNEIRRVKNKLKILEQEGSGQLLKDLLELKEQWPDQKEDLITTLKTLYHVSLTDLLRKQDKLEQASFNF